ncbi:MAG: trypsin-like peptidase domain-containing protein [Arenicellales bacterium]
MHYSFAYALGNLPAAIEQTQHSVVMLNIVKRLPEDGLDNISAQSQSGLNKLNRYFLEHFPEMGGKEGVSKITGSGFVLNHEGLIVTSAHLVKGAHSVVVELREGKTVKAKVLGVDSSTDIGLIQTQPFNSAVASPKQGALNEIKPGQSIYTIGAPFGFAGSVATGIVSAIRSTTQFLSKTKLIQTDIAINPGNSGGPVFNMKGEIIGIISQIMSTNGGSQGVSFAVSMDEVMESVSKILAQYNEAEK